MVSWEKDTVSIVPGKKKKRIKAPPGEHRRGQLARRPLLHDLAGYFSLVFDHGRSIWAYVLSVFDQVVENNGKQIVQFHPN